MRCSEYDQATVHGSAGQCSHGWGEDAMTSVPVLFLSISICLSVDEGWMGSGRNG